MPEEWRHYHLAHIKIVSWETASVYEHFFASREFHENGIGLPHIEESYFHVPVEMNPMGPVGDIGQNKNCNDRDSKPCPGPPFEKKDEENE